MVAPLGWAGWAGLVDLSFVLLCVMSIFVSLVPTVLDIQNYVSSPWSRPVSPVSASVSDIIMLGQTRRGVRRAR